MTEPQQIFQKQKQKSYDLKKAPLTERRKVLKSLKATLRKYESEILIAVEKDFRKPPAETMLTEIFPVMSELSHTLRHLRKWARPKKIGLGLLYLGSTGHMLYEPKGVTLIISPWNYPFLLTFQPLISALAAGNTVIIKPSELTPHTSTLMKKIIREVFLEDHVYLIEGDKTLSKELLKLPFDHIFFTGSTAVGQIVMQEAAKNLSPVTLELGGKSPAIVDSEFDLQIAAERLIWGKVLNLGQTCVAPDYVFIPSSRKNDFIQACLEQIRLKTEGQDLALVINESHHTRLLHLLDDAKKNGANIFPLPQSQNLSLTIQGQNSRKLGVHLVSLDRQQAEKVQMMQEEIFGPILPVLTYENIDEAIQYILKKDHPLSLYIFSNKTDVQERILKETYSGDACINEVIVHFGNHSFPIGGVGKSGMGKYHGYEGFLAFSHRRSVLRRSMFSSLFRLLYPPYTKYQLRLFRFLSRSGL